MEDILGGHAAHRDAAPHARMEDSIGPYVRTWLITLVILVGGMGIAALIDAVMSSMPRTSLAQFECVILDKAASARVALLVSDDSADGSHRLDQAIAQLRLARQHCHGGADTIARANYQALEQLPSGKLAVTVQGD